jgi:hypothetical protein
MPDLKGVDIRNLDPLKMSQHKQFKGGFQESFPWMGKKKEEMQREKQGE